jgi:hypothetical protein
MRGHEWATRTPTPHPVVGVGTPPSVSTEFRRTMAFRPLGKLSPPASLAAWLVAGAAVAAWYRFGAGNRPAEAFSAEEQRAWNDGVRQRNPQAEGAAPPRRA